MTSGFDEALLMNTRGKVSEASGMNLLVRDGVLITLEDQDILEGITRSSVIELAKHMGLQVIERPVDKTELCIADEVFLTACSQDHPIRQLETVSYPATVCDGRTASTADRDYRRQGSEFQHWVKRIELNAENCV